jgi:hypothetical protein
MAFREFTDEAGRKWTVWDVFPTFAERRERDAGPPLGVRERRRFAKPRAPISAQMARGWLAFEAADGERRRLAPIPNGWADGSTEQLRGWCATAEPGPPVRRLIE